MSRTTGSPNLHEKQEFLEIKSVSLEWKLSNLKHIFESSKGDTKSKCVKSSFFGEGKWQVFFYPNSGHDQYCSLYLSCQPTAEEFEKAAMFQLTKHAVLPSSASGSNLSANASLLKPLDPNQVPWQREGLFKFTFEIKSLDRRTTYKTMEANDHAFSHEARNWGWAQYWRRNDAFYSNPSVEFPHILPLCSFSPSNQQIVSRIHGSSADTSTPSTLKFSPTPPAPQASQTVKKLIPMDLLEAYSSLFNDPLYSDVCFKIIRRRRHQSNGKLSSNIVARRLYASKKILIRRSEYFSTMFESGFAESSVVLSNDSSDEPTQIRNHTHSDRFGSGEDCEDEDDDELMEEDSDDCDDVENGKTDDLDHEEILSEDSIVPEENPDSREAGTEQAKRDSGTHELIRSVDGEHQSFLASPDKTLQSDLNADRSLDLLTSDEMIEETGQTLDYAAIGQPSPQAVQESSSTLFGLQTSLLPTQGSVCVSPIAKGPNSLTMKIPHHSNLGLPSQDQRISAKVTNPNCCLDTSPVRVTHHDASTGKSKLAKPANARSPRKMTVIEVTDAAYTTFKALLFFLYTDTISFAPLSSTYHCLKDDALETGAPFCYASRKAYVNAMISKAAFIGNGGLAVTSGPIVDPSLVCSAKAIYRLADKLNLAELKSRAFEHITKSLTVQNIPMEVFSSFTSAYEEIRKIEVKYMLTHWNEVRDGRSIKKVLKMLSEGGKVCAGFSDIWSAILSNLEFNPKLIDSSSTLGVTGVVGVQQSTHHHQPIESTQDAVVSNPGVGGVGSQSREIVHELLWNPTERVGQGAGSGTGN